jgi:hypothetical protein
MRAFEPQPKESSKAFSAFKIYRDLGPERSLVKACKSYYGSAANLAQIKVWSSRHDWVTRARAYDDWLTMHAQAAIEEFQETKAAEFAQRQMALREKLLSNAEAAADQAATMLAWPLSQQKVLRADDEGGEITYIVMPSGWSKGTARTYQDIAAGGVIGSWTAARTGEDEAEAEYDFSGWSEEELQQYLYLSEKLSRKPAREPQT